jgi:photosystem II stability/assembly factor-like uncharacterized protein
MRRSSSRSRKARLSSRAITLSSTSKCRTWIPRQLFQWYFNGTAISNAVSSALFLSEVKTNNAGDYRVVVRNSFGSVTSAVAKLSVELLVPTVNAFVSSGSTNVLEGSRAALCASYSAAPRPEFQWLFNGRVLPGQTNGCLNLFDVTTNQSGVYSIIASNIVGVVTSAVVKLTVQQQAPVFLFQPPPQTVVEGAPVIFFANAAAGPPANYFLTFNGTNVPVPFTFSGGNAAVGAFRLLGVTAQDAGSYNVIASNFLGAVTSAVANLSVLPAGPLDRWTQRNPLPQSLPILSIVYTNNLFVAVGERGTILTSSNGTNWTVQPRRVDLTLHGVTYGKGLFVAVGEGATILTSPDGTNWTYRFSAQYQTLRSVAYGNGIFVAVGIDINDEPQLILTSRDGLVWQREKRIASTYFTGIAFGRGTFAAVGTGVILVSTNGQNWTEGFFPDRNDWESVAYLNNQFVAVGDDGMIAVSVDGNTWTPRDSGSQRRLLDIAYSNGKFVAVGARGTILSSSNTITWTEEKSDTPDRLEGDRLRERVIRRCWREWNDDRLDEWRVVEKEFRHDGRSRWDGNCRPPTGRRGQRRNHSYFEQWS